MVTSAQLVQQQSAQEKSPKTWVPGRLANAAMWLVGSPDSKHTQKADYQNATLMALLLMGTASFCGVTAATAMHEFIGLNATASVVGGLCTAFIYAAMDRTIIGMETRGKALRQAAANIYGDKETLLQKAKHVGMLASRVGIALAMGFVVTEVITTSKLFAPEIKTELDNRYQEKNRDTITYYADLKRQYDATTADLETQLGAAQADWTEQRRVSLTVDRSQVEGQNDGALQNAKQRLQAAQDNLELLNQQQQAENDILVDARTRKEAEEKGLSVAGGSGVAGCGPKCEAAALEMQQSESKLGNIATNITAAVQKITELNTEIAALEARDVQNSQRMSGNTDELETLVTGLQAQIAQRIENREAAFAALDEQMRVDPNHIETEHGLMASLSAFDEMLAKPENQHSPRLLYFALLMLLVGIETSPVLAAAMRSSTRAELRDAMDELLELEEHSAMAFQRAQILRQTIKEEVEYLKKGNITTHDPATDGAAAKVDVSGGYRTLMQTPTLN